MSHSQLIKLMMTHPPTHPPLQKYPKDHNELNEDNEMIEEVRPFSEWYILKFRCIVEVKITT